MRAGVQFATWNPHERFHTDPLRALLTDVVTQSKPKVVVMADTKPPVRGAWNVQLFHGLGDKQYTGNPLYLQARRYPRARTAASMLAHRMGSKHSFLAPPEDPGRRPSRYEQVNAYGPRFRDRFEAMLDDCEVSMFGHVALNATGGVQYDKKGPVVWFPTWDNRGYMGGTAQSSLKPFCDDMLSLAHRTKLRVKFHPHSIAYNQDAAARQRLAYSNDVHVIKPGESPYAHMDGVRAVVTDTSSLAFEAAALGLPVVILQAAPWNLGGLHDELEAMVPVITPGESIGDGIKVATPVAAAWRRDLLLAPNPAHNQSFAGGLRERADG